MFKIFFISLCFSFLNLSFAKDVSLEVAAKASDVTAEMNDEQLLLLNGYRQVFTRELEELKLDTKLYWDKLEKKKMSSKEELLFLKAFFSNEMIARPSPADPVAAPALAGTFSGKIEIDKLKAHYEEVISDLEDTKMKSFYILPAIVLDGSMSWEDVGVSKAESFTGVITDSWKKLIEKDVKGFERVVILEKDFATKPDYMNPKSVTLKWKSTLKKITGSDPLKTQFVLTAQYLLQNTKTGNVLASLDFPEQKRILDSTQKKALSSSLASLIYNLLLSQSAKIQGLVEVDSLSALTTEVEFKVLSKAGLSDLFLLNSFLQEKFKDIKLTSQMKSYSQEGSTLLVRAEGPVEKILDLLSKEGGKHPLNEQKVLLFNRADKTFAILPKESNN